VDGHYYFARQGVEPNALTGADEPGDYVQIQKLFS
jgi:hypothetical protein